MPIKNKKPQKEQNIVETKFRINEVIWFYLPKTLEHSEGKIIEITIKSEKEIIYKIHNSELNKDFYIEENKIFRL